MKEGIPPFSPINQHQHKFASNIFDPMAKEQNLIAHFRSLPRELSREIYTYLNRYEHYKFASIAADVDGMLDAIGLGYLPFLLSVTAEGDLEAFKFMEQHGLLRPRTEPCMFRLASEYGQPEVLDFWKNFMHKNGMGSVLGSAIRASIRCARAMGHIKVLDWWMRNGAVQSDYLMTSENDYTMHLDALNWTKKTIENLYLPSELPTIFSESGRVDLLQWWKDSGCELNYTSKAVDTASRERQVEVLDWWKSSGLPLKFSTTSINDASSYGNIDVLNWWVDLSRTHKDLKLKYTNAAMDGASWRGRIDVLDWWVNSGLPNKFGSRVLDDAVNNGNMEVFLWWSNSVHAEKIKMQASRNSSLFNNQEFLDWYALARTIEPQDDDSDSDCSCDEDCDCDEELENERGDPLEENDMTMEYGLLWT